MASAAGYSQTPLPAKLGIKAGMRVALLHAPDGFEATLSSLPDAVRIQHGVRRNQQVNLIVAFVTEREHLARNIGWLVTTLAPDGAFWVAWPKRAARMTTDMSEDAIRDVALPLGWVDVKVCAIDPTWSALKLVLRKALRPSTKGRVSLLFCYFCPAIGR
jgi:hypothetical protein